MKKHNKGFTLAEILVVIAIIAVLVAIIVPNLVKNIEKSKQTADNANIRHLFSQCMNEYVTTEKRTCAQGKFTVKAKYDGEFTLNGVAPSVTWPIANFSKADTYIWINISADGTIQWGANRFPVDENGMAGSVSTTFQP